MDGWNQCSSFGWSAATGFFTLQGFPSNRAAAAEFRADVFNTFNHPNFGAPDSGVGSGTEGEVFSTSVDNRRMQVSLRYSF